MAVKISKKTGKIIVWSTALLTAGVAGYFAYKWIEKQLIKMEDYELDFQKLVVRKFDKNQIIMDVFMKFTNRSNLAVTLTEQEYDIYANGIYLTTVVNKAPNTIQANSTSSVGARIDFNPAEIIAKGILNPLELLKSPKNLKIKTVMKYKVKVLFFSVPIPEIVYEDSLYNIMFVD
jgi:LEA14-like dessication related protein